MIKGKVEGAKALEDALKLLPERTRGKLLTGAVRAGANLVKKEIKARAPVGAEATKNNRKYGHLRDNIIVAMDKTRSAVTYSVGVGRAFWGRFLEFGTRFMAARPFMRPAFEASRDAAVRKMGDILGKGIEREAAKLAGETKRRG
jgi:HK97 gp10 family phage protein